MGCWIVQATGYQNRNPTMSWFIDLQADTKEDALAQVHTQLSAGALQRTPAQNKSLTAVLTCVEHALAVLPALEKTQGIRVKTHGHVDQGAGSHGDVQIEVKTVVKAPA